MAILRQLEQEKQSGPFSETPRHMRVESATVNSFRCRLTFNTETKETDLFEVESVANAV